MAAQTPAQKDALDRAVALVGEHFDNVLILATTRNHAEDGERSTVYGTRAAGNHFANAGYARQWLVNEERDCFRQMSEARDA